MTATAGVAFAQQPVIRIEDQFGNRVASDNSTVETATRIAGTSSLQGATTATASGGVATFANLSYNLAETVGGRKPLLVTAPYWQAVVRCLEQEASLASPGSIWRAPGLDIVTLVDGAADAAERLRNWKARGAF